MDLYQASPESIIRCRAIFNQIYTELNQSSKDFQASLVEKKAKTRDMKAPIDWLINSLKAYRNHNPFDLAVKISDRQLGYAEDIKLLTVPLYAAFLLAKDISEHTIDL